MVLAVTLRLLHLIHCSVVVWWRLFTAVATGPSKFSAFRFPFAVPFGASSLRSDFTLLLSLFWPLPLPLLLVGALMPRGTVMRFVDLGRVPRAVTKPGEYSGMLSLLDTVPASLLLSSPSSFTLNESPRVPSTPGPVSTPGPSPSLWKVMAWLEFSILRLVSQRRMNKREDVSSKINLE